MAELKKEALMRRIQEACFAAHECVLYLDGHPHDRKALAMHKKYNEAAKQLTAQYEANFGPLTADAAEDGGRGWNWTSGKWPWQRTEG